MQQHSSHVHADPPGPPASSAVSGPPSLATLRLALARGVGPATVTRLREHLGRDEDVVAAPPRRIADQLGITISEASRLTNAWAAIDPWIEYRRALRGDATILGPADAA